MAEGTGPAGERPEAEAVEQAEEYAEAVGTDPTPQEVDEYRERIGDPPPEPPD
jgi:hypothetical protein